MLMIETSTRTPLVAVAEGGRVLGERRMDAARRNARDLVPLIEELLRERGWAVRDLEVIAAGVGPGSYTGLRVGLMTAKTLAYVTGRKLVGVETFAVLARQAPMGPVDVLADAQRESIYVQAYEDGAAVGPLEVRLVGEWLATRRAGAWATGPALEKYAGRLAGVAMTAADAWRPGAAAFLAAALVSPAADVMGLGPLYAQASSAEIQWAALGR